MVNRRIATLRQKEAKMAWGTVKWFNDAKGFGFIEPEGGGQDIFAHFSCIHMEGFRTLKQGSRVSYDLVIGPKGQLAQNICPATEPKPQANSAQINEELKHETVDS
jgi:cold shock protein